MGEIRYDPACLPCRLAVGKPDAGVKRECHDHQVARLTRERDDLRAILASIAACGVAHRTKYYAEVQIDHETLADLRAALVPKE